MRPLTRQYPFGGGLIFCLLLGMAGSAMAQGLRFSTQREVTPPDYATFRLGMFYSTMALTETVGYRHTWSSGTGTDYLIDNNRGTIKKDGGDFPILSTLTFRNYLVLSRNVDLDATIRIGYYYYPLDTQEDEFIFDATEEGLYGNISVGFRMSDFVRGTIYEQATYRTDYIDTRGVSDNYGGSQYEYFHNDIGAQINWDMARDHSTAISLARRDNLPKDDETYADQKYYQYYEGLTYSYQVGSSLAVGARVGSTQTYYDSPDREDTRLQDYSLFLTYGRGGQEMAGVALTERSTLRLSVGTAVGYRAERADQETDTTTAQDDWDSGSVTMTGRAELETLMSKTLTQVLSYQRGIRQGFNSAFEEYESARYELRWQGELSSARAWSSLSSVDPSLTSENNYQDWENGVSLSWPIRKWLTLSAQTAYTFRNNDFSSSGTDETTDVENTADYDTWVSRLGTTFRVMKEVTFTSYIQHVARFSDAEELEYTRDTFYAGFSYTHQF